MTALTTRQTVSPPALRSMTTAVHRWATYGVLPLGALLAGAVAHAGVRPAMLLTAAIGQAATLSLLASGVRRLTVVGPAEPGAQVQGAGGPCPSG